MSSRPGDLVVRLRGWIDGLISPRRHEGTETQREKPFVPSRLGAFVVQPGDSIDFFRVEAIGRDRLLLYSQLKVPGEAWMEWRVGRTVAEPAAGGASPTHGTTLTQTSFFAPRGLPGFLYWALLYPFHSLVFRGLIRAVARHAASPQSSQSPRSRD